MGRDVQARMILVLSGRLASIILSSPSRHLLFSLPRCSHIQLRRREIRLGPHFPIAAFMATFEIDSLAQLTCPESSFGLSERSIRSQ